jgi:hypothetical protein
VFHGLTDTHCMWRDSMSDTTRPTKLGKCINSLEPVVTGRFGATYVNEGRT